MVSVKIKTLHPNVVLPKYMTPGASGCDVSAFLTAPLEIRPSERLAVPTGLSFEIPEGYEIQVRPRSGLSLKQGLTVVNAPGTIDSDYRGELKVLLINLSQETAKIQNGDRIAQLVLQKVEQAKWEIAESLEATTRAEGGFGSTGVNTPAPQTFA